MRGEAAKLKRREWECANKVRTVAQRKAWALANPERQKAQKARHYAKHKTKERARSRAWALANPEKVKASRRRNYVPRPRELLSAEELKRRERARARKKSQRREAAMKSTDKGRLKLLWRRAAVRARKKGVPFNIQFEDLQLPTKCPVFGTPMSFMTGAPLKDRFSLDRTNPAKGYVPGNVVVMSFRANTVKGDATIGELRAVLAYLELQEMLS